MLGKWFKRLPTVLSAMLTVVIAVAVSHIRATAQTAEGIPQLLQQILAAATDLQKSMNAIQDSSLTNVRFTPPVFNFTFSGENGGCEVVNVRSSLRIVETQARSF